MNSIDASRIIFETLSELRPIETALVSMWSLSDKYARIPFLRFRFKDLSKNDLVYIELMRIIDDYSGKLRWSMITKDNTRNYIITPKCFERFFLEQMSINKEHVLAELVETEYYSIIDTVVADVSDLADYIKISFKY